jgi:hypothetical protein
VTRHTPGEEQTRGHVGDSARRVARLASIHRGPAALIVAAVVVLTSVEAHSPGNYQPFSMMLGASALSWVSPPHARCPFETLRSPPCRTEPLPVASRA